MFSATVCGSVACHSDNDDLPTNARSAAISSAAPVIIEQVTPPLDLKAPPSDAVKAPSGVSYKKLVSNDVGAQPKPGEMTRVRYTGWRQGTGETFFSTQRRSQPIAIDPAHSIPAFADVLPLLHKGETAMLWVPPAEGTPEAVVYEIELVDIVAPPVAAKQVTRDR